MKKILITLFLILVSLSLALAQYSSSIGLRGGLSQGVTYKQLSESGKGYEIIASTRWQGFGLTGIYESQNNLGGVENLYVYYGFGGHIGYYDIDKTNWSVESDDDTNEDNPDNQDQQESTEEIEVGEKIVLGADVILGVEYVFEDLPLALSFDWKPAFNFLGNKNFWGDNAAISARYLF